MVVENGRKFDSSRGGGEGDPGWEFSGGREIKWWYRTQREGGGGVIGCRKGKKTSTRDADGGCAIMVLSAYGR
jgi:hypothetical protein